jgi:hypothetical protein
MSERSRRKRKTAPGSEEFPAKPTKKRANLVPFDNEIREMVMLRLKPGTIAERLRTKHSLSDAECNGQAVSNRISVMKKKGLITIPSVQGEDTIVPLEEGPPGKCFFFLFFSFLYFVFLFSFSGGKLAKALTEDESDIVSDVVEDPDIEFDERLNEAIYSRFSDSGLFFSHETIENFVVYFARPHHSNLRVSKQTTDGIRINYDAVQPPAHLFEVSCKLTGLNAVDIERPKSTCSLFIPAPKPLDQHQKPKIFYYPEGEEAKTEWIIVVIPFLDDDSDHELFTMEARHA